MENHDQETTSALVKAGTYIVGLLLGLGAKLALMNKEKTLTMKEFIMHSMVAFACAWVVWYSLRYYGKLELANVCSVVVGRYADLILFSVWKQLKSMIDDFKPHK